MRLMTTATAAALGLAALAAGCGGGSSSATSTTGGTSASAFVKQVTTEFSRGQSGRLWDTLLPADQAVVTRARFVDCQPNDGWDLKQIKVIDTYDDPVYVNGKAVPAKAVTVRVTSDGITTATMHAVSVNGTWRWVLQPSDRAAYQSGKCPRTA